MDDWRKRHEAHCAEYREQVRKTMQAFSDKALRFQDSIIVGGIDREECDREIARRWTERFAAAKTSEELAAADEYRQEMQS